MIIKNIAAKQLLYKHKMQPFLYIFTACITQPQEVQPSAQIHSQRPILRHETP